MRRLTGAIAAVAFAGSVLVANYLVDRFGFAPVGFGLQAPAGVYAVGLTFLLRDVVQRTIGVGWALAAIAAGAALSAFVSPALAVASAAAFVASELVDLAVYSALARRSWAAAVVTSNAAGAVVDSVVFLILAFGTLDYVAGQIVGKLWVTAAFLALAVLVGLRPAALRGPA